MEEEQTAQQPTDAPFSQYTPPPNDQGDTSENALAKMRYHIQAAPKSNFVAFQSMDMSSETLGDVVFIRIGEDSTLKVIPPQAPDGQWGLGWRYKPVGYINLETGKIVTERPNG
jgi:hypothetical protein